MTELLSKAFAEADRLSEKEQNSLARWLLAELDSERLWQEKFAASGDFLKQLAQEALEEDLQGLTQELDPDRLGSRRRRSSSGQRSKPYQNPSSAKRDQRIASSGKILTIPV